MERDLTSGSVFRNVIYFSLPYFLSYFLQTLYGMADLFIVGQFDGVASTTAVSIGSQVMHMLTVMIVGLAMGATVSIGQSIGAGDKKRASVFVGNTVILFMGISLVLAVLLLFFVKPAVAVMSTPAEAVSGTAAYLTICFLGIPFITAYNVISSIFRGLGDSKSPMYFIAVACAVNIILDYLFIGFFHLGASGAALGTTLSQACSVLFALIAIKRKQTGLSLSGDCFRPQKKPLGKILNIGIPVALQDGFIQIAFIIITIIANRRGLNAAAAVGIVEKIISAMFIVPSSMLAAVSALSSQNLGAGKPERAAQTLKYAAMIATGYGIAVVLVIELVAEPLLGCFTTDAAVVLMGCQYIRGYIVDTIFAGIHFSFTGYFAACGKSYVGFLHNIIAIVLVRVPGSYLASRLFAGTLLPMGLAAPAGSLLSVMICVAAYRWMKRRGTLYTAA